ncbi:hypothetical protein NGM37_28775, partial [Streptomyces sp. TRM76130]|nr:hypothetical protein [Streptomyces sp. TRM76130]
MALSCRAGTGRRGAPDLTVVLLSRGARTMSRPDERRIEGVVRMIDHRRGQRTGARRVPYDRGS